MNVQKMKGEILKRKRCFDMILNPDFEYRVAKLLKGLALKDVKQYNCFFQYMQFVNILRQEEALTCGLEIGSGYSTFALALLAEEKNVRIYSVDADIKKLIRIGGKRCFSLLDKKLCLINDWSISYDDFMEFYLRKHECIGGVSAEEIYEHLDLFIKPHRYSYATLFEKNSIEIYKDVFFDRNKKIVFRKEIINYRGRFDEAIACMYAHKKNGVGAIDTLLHSQTVFDFIYFDCGEYASIIEWEKLKGRIKVGGFAIFHDIYFPKSIKNFIVCASIIADPDWQCVYQDKTMPQGLMIAKRMR